VSQIIIENKTATITVAKSYTLSAHNHLISEVTGLQLELDSKSDIDHTHTGYQPIGDYADLVHSHVISDVTGLQIELDGKSSTSHNHDATYQPIGNYASSTHNHDLTYSSITHNHDATYQPIGNYASSTHNHDTTYQPIGNYSVNGHGHIISDVTGLQTELDGKSSTSHNHSGVYQPIGNYALDNHNHDLVYASITHDHDLDYQPIGSYALDSHNHTGVYQPVGSYLTANQTITLSGDATGSGTTSIDVTLNTIPISKGGTGQTTANAAFNALAPSQSSNSGKYLTTDGTNSNWTSLPTVANTLDDLTDVVITTPSTDQILKFNGTNWVNGTASGSASPSTIDVISYSFFGGL
jgi:hypothetical protein